MTTVKSYAVVLCAIILGGCTVSMATTSTDIQNAVPGYTPTFGDWFGSSLSISDVQASTFQSSVCVNDDVTADSAYVLSISGTGVSLAPRGDKDSIQTTITEDTPSKAGDVVSGKIIRSDALDPGIGTTRVRQTITKNENGIPVKRCSLKIITAAVNLCVHRTASRNVLDKIENYGVDQVVALGGLAAGIAALSHASGKDTALAVAGAAGVSALANGLQKAVPTSTSAQIAPVITAGLQFLELTDGQPMSGIQKGLLFDAAFSACPIAS